MTKEVLRQSYLDLVRIYKPDDLVKFTRDFCKRYGCKGHEQALMKLVKEKRNISPYIEIKD